MEGRQGTSIDTRLSLRENFLVRQKTFRLLASDALGFMSDLLTQFSREGEESSIGERAELRRHANTINMGRYILDKEIGSRDFHEQVERYFMNEFEFVE